MKDPRRGAYRAECASAARRGLIPLRWPKTTVLFLSNLNDNVNEQLLHEELSRYGRVKAVNIPTLHGRAAGLARAIIESRRSLLINELDGKELLGKRLHVVPDPESKNFTAAMHQLKDSKANHASKAGYSDFSRKQHACNDRMTQFSPASAFRNEESARQRSSANPKRPRSGSEHLSPSRDSEDRSFRDANRRSRFSYQNTRPLHERSDFKDVDPVPFNSNHRSHARGSPHGNYRDQSSKSHTGRPRNRNESGHYYSSKHAGSPDRLQDNRRYYRDGAGSSTRRRDDAYDAEFRRHSRYSPPRQNASTGHNRHYNSYTSTRREDLTSFPEQSQLDIENPALFLGYVPKHGRSSHIMRHFSAFYPRGAKNMTRGNWIVFFDRQSDCDEAYIKASAQFHGTRISIHKARKLANRSSRVDKDGSTPGNRGQDRANFVSQNGREKLVRDSYHAENARYHTDRLSAREHRNSLNRQSDNPRAHYRDRKDGWMGRTDPKEYHQQAPWNEGKKAPLYLGGSVSHTSPQSNERAAQRSEHSPRREKTRPAENGCMSRSRNGAASNGRNEERGVAEVNAEKEQRSKRLREDGPSYARDDEARSLKKRRYDHDDASGNEGFAIPSSENVKASGGMHPGSETIDGDSCLHQTRVEDVAMPRRNDSKESAAEIQNAAATADAEKVICSARSLHSECMSLSEKPRTTDELIDVVSKRIYQSVKDSIARKATAVHRGLVAQSVMRFLKSRKSRESPAKPGGAVKRTIGKKPLSEKRGPSSSTHKTAHLDLMETFLKPQKANKQKPPLPESHGPSQTKKKARKSRFSQKSTTDQEKTDCVDEQHLSTSERLQGEEISEEDKLEDSQRSKAYSKQSHHEPEMQPSSPDPGHVSPDGNRKNSVESMEWNEFFEVKDGKGSIPSASACRDSGNVTSSSRTLKVSSLKVSSIGLDEGDIPHLVVEAKRSSSPSESVPALSALTTSEDSASHVPAKLEGDVKNKRVKKKGGAKSRTKKLRSKTRSVRKSGESHSDIETTQSGILCATEDPINDEKGDGKKRTEKSIEILESKDFVSMSPEREDVAPKKEPTKNPMAFIEPEREERCFNRVGKCARTDVYVRAEHVTRHRQRNVHSRVSTSGQSSRQCRQDNRIYRKGVKSINPKNDIITLNHLKQRRKSVAFAQSHIHGMGLFAKENIDAGEFIIEYVGDLIRRVVADLREQKYTRLGMGDSYLFRLAGDWVIDATRRGGIARFINHSCEPNVFAKIITVVGEPKIVFYSKRVIKEGEELTYDYKFDYEGEDKKIQCLCQAPGCRKYLN